MTEEQRAELLRDEICKVAPQAVLDEVNGDKWKAAVLCAETYYKMLCSGEIQAVSSDDLFLRGYGVYDVSVCTGEDLRELIKSRISNKDKSGTAYLIVKYWVGGLSVTAISEYLGKDAPISYIEEVLQECNYLYKYQGTEINIHHINKDLQCRPFSYACREKLARKYDRNLTYRAGSVPAGVLEEVRPRLLANVDAGEMTANGMSCAMGVSCKRDVETEYENDCLSLFVRGYAAPAIAELLDMDLLLVVRDLRDNHVPIPDSNLSLNAFDLEEVQYKDAATGKEILKMCNEFGCDHFEWDISKKWNTLDTSLCTNLQQKGYALPTIEHMCFYTPGEALKQYGFTDDVSLEIGKYWMRGRSIALIALITGATRPQIMSTLNNMGYVTPYVSCDYNLNMINEAWMGDMEKCDLSSAVRAYIENYKYSLYVVNTVRKVEQLDKREAEALGTILTRTSDQTVLNIAKGF